MASKGGSIDRVKYDGMKRDANSRFYAIFPEVRLRTFPRVVAAGWPAVYLFFYLAHVSAALPLSTHLSLSSSLPRASTWS